jgi:tetratricopeptide (TPR) repeat protein
MKLKEWTKAKSICSKIIELDNNIVKAWYRRGECSMNLEKFDEAKDDFIKVIQLEPTNKAAMNKSMECMKHKVIF